MLTIVNEGSSLTIVNIIVNKFFFQNDRIKNGRKPFFSENETIVFENETKNGRLTIVCKND